MRVEWHRKTLPEGGEEGLASLRQWLQERGRPPWLAELLVRRGVADPARAAAFLDPSLEHLHPSSALDGLEAAVERLKRASEAGEGVALVGDYDVDGVSGTALLAAVLRARGMEVKTILPHRMREGYGFQPTHVDEAVAGGCSLVVTIDCGTTSHGAVEKALDAGLDVVITDHHLPGEPLPEAVILINPHRPDSSYPFPELSGAGLAFKLALAFAEATPGRRFEAGALLRIACLGTIADLVPLVDENRVIAKLGLEQLEQTKSKGLRALIDVARIRPPFTTEDVGFRLGPRLNAPGRLDSAEPSLELLLSRDSRRARHLATILDARNRERQEWERRVADEARQAILAKPRLPTFAVAWSESWHKGVVGIAAGRLARELNRPVLLLARDGDTATGSGRSIPGIHLFDFLDPWRPRLVRFGGHAQAVGLTAEVARLEELEAEWQGVADRDWSDRVAVKEHHYELELSAREAGETALGAMGELEPFGQGNSRPLLRIRGPLRVDGSPRMFGRDHVEAQLVAEDGGRIRVIGWGWQKRMADLRGGVEILGYLELDRYRGQPVLRLLDSRPMDAHPTDAHPVNARTVDEDRA